MRLVVVTCYYCGRKAKMTAAWGKKVADKHIAEVGYKLVGATHKRARAWAAVRFSGMALTAESENSLPAYARYNDGWNGSYHECEYEPQTVLCFGRNPAHARRRLQAVMAAATYRTREDSSTIEMRARMLVRAE